MPFQHLIAFLSKQSAEKLLGIIIASVTIINIMVTIFDKILDFFHKRDDIRVKKEMIKILEDDARREDKTTELLATIVDAIVKLKQLNATQLIRDTKLNEVVFAIAESGRLSEEAKKQIMDIINQKPTDFLPYHEEGYTPKG